MTTTYQTKMSNDAGRNVGDEAAMLAEAVAHFGVADANALIVRNYATGDVGIRPRKGIVAWLWYVRAN